MGRIIKQARDGDRPLFLCSVNWGEVWYIVKRAAGPAAADRALATVDTLPIEVVAADRPLALEAAKFKSDRKMSYADCFAAALAKTRKAELVTGDREFKEVEEQIRIHWLPANKPSQAPG